MIDSYTIAIHHYAEDKPQKWAVTYNFAGKDRREEFDTEKEAKDVYKRLSVIEPEFANVELVAPSNVEDDPLSEEIPF